MTILRPYPYAKPNGLWHPTPFWAEAFDQAFRDIGEFYAKRPPRKSLWSLCEEIIRRDVAREFNQPKERNV